MNFICIFDGKLLISLMDFITVIIFMLVMAAVFYQRLMENARKDAARKKKQHPPVEKHRPSMEADPAGDVSEEVPAPMVMYVNEANAPVPAPREKKGKKRNMSSVAERTPEQMEKRHPSVALKNVSEARRAFIYSEIFKRKYE